LKETHDKYGVPYEGWKDGDPKVPYGSIKKRRRSSRKRRKRRRRRRGALAVVDQAKAAAQKSMRKKGKAASVLQMEGDAEESDEENDVSPTETPQGDAMLQYLNETQAADALEATPVHQYNADIAAAAAAVGARAAAMLPQAQAPMGLPMDWNQFPRSDAPPLQPSSLLDTSYEVGSSGSSRPALMRRSPEAEEGEQ